MNLLGAHTSIKGGVCNSLDLAESLGFTAMQIFTKSSNQWAAKEISLSEAENFRNKLKLSPVKSVIAHSSYLINLCASDKALLKKSIDAFIIELQRCELLGIPHLNFHPGAHGGQGIDEGIKIIADSINQAHLKTSGFKVKSMFELTAGQGTS